MPKYISVDSSVEVVDSLSSDKSGAALSAKQGKNLNTKINNIKIPQLIAGSGIDIEYTNNIYKIHADPYSTSKYNATKINTMLSKWTVKTLPSTYDFVSIAYSQDLMAFVAVASNNNQILVSWDGGASWAAKDVQNNESIVGYHKVYYSDYLHMFCAVAKGSNKIVTSFDSYTWNAVPVTGVPEEYGSICYSDELRIFCAIPYNTYSLPYKTNGIAVSRDGITWQVISLPEEGDWVDIIWASKLHMFVGIAKGSTNGKKIITSVNGYDWKIVALPRAQDYRALAYSRKNNIVCAIAYNSDEILTSPDGKTWTNNKLPRTMNLTCLTYLSVLQMFCALEENSDKFIVSTDGLIWTEKSLGTGNNKAWSSITYDLTKDVFVGIAKNSNSIIFSKEPTSLDIIWIKKYTLPIQVGNGLTWAPMVYMSDQDKLCTFMNTKNTMVSSTDGGESWSASDIVTTSFVHTLDTTCYSPKLGIICGIYSTHSSDYRNSYKNLVISEDRGATWRNIRMFPDHLDGDDYQSWGSNQNIFIWSNELEAFYIGNTSAKKENRILTSKDGVTWNEINMQSKSAFRILYPINFNGYKLLAYTCDYKTYTHYIYITKDGIVWEQRQIGKLQSSFMDICYSEDLNLYCLINNGSKDVAPIITYTSKDLITWDLYKDTSESGIGSTHRISYWSSSMQCFVIINQQNVCAVSPDGKKWVKTEIHTDVGNIQRAIYLPNLDRCICQSEQTNKTQQIFVPQIM